MSRLTNTSLWPRRYPLGMWAYVLHRLSGVFLALYGILHIWIVSQATRGPEAFDRILRLFSQPYFVFLEWGLIGIVVYHVLNGLRLVLLELGVGLNRQKSLFWALMAVGIIVMAGAGYALGPYMLGRPTF